MAGRFDNKKAPAGPQRSAGDVEQEEAAPEHERAEPEHARLQNQMGNQGLAALMASSQAGTGSGTGVDGGFAQRAPTTGKSSPAHGGDDDPIDDGPLTLEDLSRSWNPGTRKSEERARFLEPMPDDELPPEDPDFAERLRACPDPLPLPPSWTIDGLLQPSPSVIAASLLSWSRGAARWSAPSLGWRATRLLVAPPPPVLQDPHGRVLLGRARASAIATWMLIASPTLARGANTTTAAFVDFCLEMASRDRRMHDLYVIAEEGEARLPLASRLFSDNLAIEGGRVHPVRLGPDAHAALVGVFGALLDLPDPLSVVPDLQEVTPEPDDDDPLGLDAVMASMTGGDVDPSDALFRTAIQAAERLAAAAARVRVRFAGLALAIADVATLWTRGAPVANLRGELEALDRDIAGVLQLLVEIARAAQARTVAPQGLRTGLRKAARRLTRVEGKSRDALAQIVGGILPGAPELSFDPEPAPDPLSEAVADGEPGRALSWLATLDPSPDRTAALLWTRAASGEPAATLAQDVAAVRAHAVQAGDLPVAAIAGVVLGACLLDRGDTDAALRLAAEQLETGRHRRNGVMVAEAALLAVEAHRLAGDPDAAERHRLRAANLVWRMGATGALSLLSRWTPPEHEPAEA